MPQAAYSTHGPIALISMNNPPVNGLGYELRSGIVAGLDQALADPKIAAVVLIGSAKAFSGGADIREFNSPKALAEPNLNTVIRVVESSSKPVIAAIGGACMGGGLELALGCHFRVAVAGAQIGLPEVKLGILPGAGGTQRLPRLIGLEPALDMMLSGKPLSEADAVKVSLADTAVDGDVTAAAVAYARELVAAGKGPRRTREMSVAGADRVGEILAARRAQLGKVFRNRHSPHVLLDAVRAAVELPFDAGIARERELSNQVERAVEGRAFRHLFFGERELRRIPGLPADVKSRKVAKVGIVGAGTMGGGISMCFANAGIPVTIVDAKQEALDRGLATIRKNYERSVARGSLKPEQLEQRMALIRPTLDYAALGDADLVIEAVFENMKLKKEIFAKLDAAAKPGAILGTNTSTLDIDEIAAVTQRPQDVIGLHFFSPANVMRLLEIVQCAKTAPDVVMTALDVAKTIRKVGVVAEVCYGFIGNRMMEPYGRVAGFLVEEGATPWQVDKALEKWGMAMGPFRMGDLAGNDIGWAIRKRRYVEKPDVKYARIADKLCELGRFGQKTGMGWYRYEAGKRDAIPDPVVEKLIEDYRKEQGITPRKIADAEIVERCIFALVNEAARLLEEGIAQRASDVDMVYLTGYGFPLHRGGPMLYADQVGLYNVVRAAQRFAAESGDKFWQPAPLLAKLAAEGKTFN